jgi:uncharacterized cupredoxin-like copper-binding protein
MRARTRRLGAATLLLTLATLALAACGGGSSSGTTATPSAGGSSATAASTTVTATEKEFSITLSQRTFAPGAYSFQVVNGGTFPHNLTIAGPGVDNQASPTLQAGQSGSLSVTLQAGSYELWCSVDGHKDRGMDIKITVA